MMSKHLVADGEPSVFPLSDIQLAYLVGRKGIYDLGNVGIHFYFEVDNIFDYDRLNVAWQRTIERHPMLRAHVVDGQSQTIKESVNYQVQHFDISDLSIDERLEYHANFRETLSHRIYDPEIWPLFDLILCENGRDSRLYISIDAINIDLNSFIIIFNNLFAYYADKKVEPAPLYSYRDYVLQLETIKEDSNYQGSQTFWAERLPNLPPAPVLPVRCQPSSLKNHHFSRLEHTFDKTLWTSAQKYSQKVFGVTPSTLLLASFAEVLRAWSEEPDFTLNVTVFNRYPFHEDVHSIEGDFTSMFFVEAEYISGPFHARAKAIQKQIWTCLQHRYGAGPEALRTLRASKESAGHKAFFPIVFTSALSLELDQKGLYGALGQLGCVSYALTQTPQLSLDYQVHEVDGDLYIIWDYVDTLYPEGMIEEIFSAYIKILEQLFSNPETWQLPKPDVFDVGTYKKLNETDANFEESTLQTLFKRRCQEGPDRIALITTDKSVTYKVLHAQAQLIASELKVHGLVHQGRVGLLLGKSIDQVAAVFGTLLAGGVYVPMDIDAPASRIDNIIEDAQFDGIITHTLHKEFVDSFETSIPIIFVDTLPSSTGQQITPSIDELTTSSDLAYLLYTSGSTGTPKGVEIEHRSVINRMSDVVNRYEITSSDVAFGVTALHHDLSVFDIFGMLAIAGGAIALPTECDRRDPSKWIELIDKANVSVWNSVPAFGVMLCDYCEDRDRDRVKLASLRLFVLSGDFIPLSLPGRLKQLISGVEIIGSGGPTESTVWDVTFAIDTVSEEWRSIPYGRPLSNARYYVMDNDLNERPVWAIGEFCIGGVGLARGYRNNETLNCEKFINHPGTGERLFRSGDLGYIDNQGRLNIVGRKDFQVKIHGERIEIGEIESVLNSHESVNNCAVILDEITGTDQKRLIAYVNTQQEHQLGTKNYFEIKDVTNKTSVDKIEFKLEQKAIRGELWPAESIHLESALPVPAALSLHNRFSARTFLDRPVTTEQVGRILSPLSAFYPDECSFPKYSYPSAGGLYPVQSYIIVRENMVEGVAAGSYYFHPIEQSLMRVGGAPPENPENHTEDNAKTVSESAFTILLVSDEDAMQPSYGDLTRDFCLIEAGYIGQALMTAAPTVGVGLCPIGAFKMDDVRDILNLSANQEVLHSFACGSVLPVLQPVKSTHPTLNDNIIENIRQFASQYLVGHMMPELIILVENWPLNSSGKLDRSALPIPIVSSSPVTYIDSDQKNDSAIQKLRKIFETILEIESIPLDESYNKYGANSMSLIRIHRVIEQEFELEMQMRTVFDEQTLSGLWEAMKKIDSEVEYA